MKVLLGVNTCIVTKEPGDPKLYNESLLLHRVKVELIKQGHDVIKKLMYKDGHMVADTEHYIRERKGKWAIWFSDYALRLSTEDYNQGIVTYRVDKL